MTGNTPETCPTVRRLAMIRRLASNATCSTSRAMAERLADDWFHCSLDRFSRQLPPKAERKVNRRS